MKRASKWALFALSMVVRTVLIVAGWVLPVHINYKTPRTQAQKMNLWERYLENSWRNPTPYLRSMFKQPILEVRPNPDKLVRSGSQAKATRLMESGPFIEYWSLGIIRSGPWAGRYWEFRIGWKFVDSEETFWPTIQLGPKK